MRVLIATDGSEFSTAAVREYAHFIACANDEVRVVSVVEPLDHIVGAPFGVMDDFYGDYLRKARSEAETYLQEAASVLKNATKQAIKVETEILIGPPAQTIVEAAREWQPALIVVGSHGRGFWQRMYLGSVSNSVLHHAECSVLVVKKAGSANKTS